MLKFTPDNTIEPSRGSVLIAEPFMDDPFFKRTVILMCEHNEEGSFGFVLNHYIEDTMSKLMPDLGAISSRVSVGGPVKNSNLYYIHALGDRIEDSLKITDNLYMGGNFEQLKELVRKGQVSNEDIRFFVGYAGWSAGQLDQELKSKSWFVTEADEPLLMDTSHDDLWTAMVSRLGQEYAHLVHTPHDPSLN
jgi:putative transcriptional regulator